jgi:cytoskeletal protein CcmA (bactofilin family)
MNVAEIDVGGTVKVAGGRSGDMIKVGGSFRASEPLEFNLIDVGGTVRLSGGKGGDIEVGGSLKCEGDLEFEHIDVWGTVRIEGNASGRSIDVGGTARVNGDLELTETLSVGGRAEVGGGLRARRVQVGGRIEAEKVEAVEDIKTNTLLTRLGAVARNIEIGKRGEVEGPLVGETILIRDRARVEDVHGQRVTLRRGCRAHNVYGATVVIEDGCRISGEMKYTERLEADRDVAFAVGPAKVEKLPDPPL